MAMNEPVDCPYCGTTNDAMPDAKKANYENAPGSAAGLENVLDTIKMVTIPCSNPACVDAEGRPKTYQHQRIA